MSGVLKTHVQLGDSGTATNNFMVTAQDANGTMKIARGNNGATTQDVMTVNSSGQVAFPQGRSAWNSGEVIQEVLALDAGSSAAHLTLANLNAASIVFNPKSTNSKILVVVHAILQITNVTAANTAATFQLNDVAVPFSNQYILQAASASGGMGNQVPGVVAGIYNNSNLTAKAFRLYGVSNNASASVGATNMVWSIREVQN